MTVADRGPFAQLPYTLWNYLDLCPLERWLCATIIKMCWQSGPQAFSYRTIAKESGISIGSLCPTEGKSKYHEGMMPKLERLGLIKTYRPIDEEGKIIKGVPFLVEPTKLLWSLNKEQEQSAYLVSTLKPEKTDEGVYSVNGTAYLVSTSAQQVSTPAYSVNTQEGISLDEKRDEQAPIDSIDKEDKRDSSASPREQITEPFDVPPLPLRDDVSVNKSSYSHEPAESEWLCEIGGEEDIFEEDADPTEKRPVVSQGGNLAPGERRAPLESKDRREGSNEHPAVKPTGSGPPPASPGRAAQLREQPTIQSTPADSPRQPTRTPEPEAGTPPLPDKTGEKGNRKKDAPLLCETKKVRELIDATRGHALEDPGALINQSKIIHAWCEKHPIEHATLVLHHIMTSTCKKHVWWRAHLDAFSAKALAQLTSEILPELGIIPKPELPPDIPMPAATPQANGKYHPYTRASMYDPIEIGV